MIHTTTWSPDTCDCKFEYDWDDTLTPEQRVNTVSKVIQTCSTHQIIKLNPNSHFSTVADENVRKNKVHSQFFTVAGMTDSISNPDGSTTIVFKDGIEVTYNFTGTDYARVLNITVVGYNLTGGQKNAIQNWCNNTFGISKVNIN